MTNDCPRCGSTLEPSTRTIEVQVLACPGCHHHFSMLPHAAAGTPEAPAEGAASLPPVPSEGPTGEGKSGGGDDTPVCGTCGSELVIRAADDVTIEVECPQCDETTRFRAESAEAPPRSDRPERSDYRGPRGPPRGRDGPPARGCRRCGGPLEFEVLPNGGRLGRCANCGNEFRLPPRDDSGPRYGRGGPRTGGFRDRRGGPPRGGGYGRDRRPRRDDDEGSDDDERPRRRFPPRKRSSED